MFVNYYFFMFYIIFLNQVIIYYKFSIFHVIKNFNLEKQSPEKKDLEKKPLTKKTFYVVKMDVFWHSG